MKRLSLYEKMWNPRIRARIRDIRVNPTAGPVIVELDPTSFCDLACPSCITGDVLNQGRFTAERLLEISEELSVLGVMGVILIGGGEPLAHRGTLRLIESLSTRGIEIGVVTNGTMADRYLQVLAQACSWVRFSIDAATDVTYGSVRPTRSGLSRFDDVISNLRMLASLGERRSSVGYSFVVQGGQSGGGQRNLEEVARAAELARELHCDYVEFKAEMGAGHQVIPLRQDDRSNLHAQLELARTQACEGFDVYVSSSLRALIEGEPPAGQAKQYTACPIAELRTTISPSGCFVCSYHRGNPAHRYGDPVASSLVELWENRSIATNPSRDCHFHCARHDLNLALESGELLSDSDSPFEESSDIFL